MPREYKVSLGSLECLVELQGHDVALEVWVAVPYIVENGSYYLHPILGRGLACKM